MSHVQLATKTLAKIESVIKADQGSSYRGKLGEVIMHVGDAYRTGTDGHRSHLGASGLGQECARAIWYNFRWATKSNFSGRLMRLFNRGHLEEARFIAMLLAIGCQVYQQDANGEQFRISFAEGHAGGSGDGVVIGLPDLPDGTPALAEFKTHSEKSFKELEAKGMRTAKFQHYVQMQLYMRKMGLAVGFYLAVNKNNDALYGEIVHLDTAVADQFIDRGTQLVWMQDPPVKLNESPGFFMCKWCDHRPVCHLKAKADVNCRTCAHSKPVAGKAWECTLYQMNIDKETQLKGCIDYIPHKSFE